MIALKLLANKNGQQLIDSENALNCDVILMDIRMQIIGYRYFLAGDKDWYASANAYYVDDHELVNGYARWCKDTCLKVIAKTLVDIQIKNGKTLIQPAVTEKVLQGLKGLNVEFESFENPEPLTEKEGNSPFDRCGLQ